MRILAAIVLLHIVFTVRADHCPLDSIRFEQLLYDQSQIDDYLDSLLLLPLSRECEYDILIHKYSSYIFHGVEEKLVFEHFSKLVNSDISKDYPKLTFKLYRLHAAFLINHKYYSKSRLLVDSLLELDNIDPYDEMILLSIKAGLLMTEKKGVLALKLLKEVNQRLESHPKLGTSISRIQNYAQLATLFAASDNYKQALHYCDKAIRLSHEEKVELGLAQFFVLSAHCHGGLGNRSAEKAMLDSAKVYLKKSTHANVYTDYYLAKARFLHAECLYDSSQQCINLAIKSMREGGSNIDLEKVYEISIANKLVLMEGEGYTEIIEKIEECCSNIISRNDSIVFSLLKVVDRIPESDKSLKTEILNSVSSFRNYEFQTIEDELRKALVKYEMDKKEAENLLLKKETELNRTTIQNQRFYILTLVLGLSTLWILLYAYWKSFKEKKRHLVQLEIKNGLIESLNKEINHRTKNHLALATSLLSKSRMETADETTRYIIRDNENKLRSLVLINQKLSDKQENENLSLKLFLDELCEDLIFSFQNSLIRKIDLKLKVDDLLLDSEFCLRLGLVTNELLTNSVKHAQTDGLPLEIVLSISREKDSIAYSYSDNGTGADLSSQNQGLELVSQLIEQLDGKFQHSVNGVYFFQAIFNYQNSMMLS